MTDGTEGFGVQLEQFCVVRYIVMFVEILFQKRGEHIKRFEMVLSGVKGGVVLWCDSFCFNEKRIEEAKKHFSMPSFTGIFTFRLDE